MKARQFWYPLPERLIAQHPAERRGTERMMVLHRDTGVIEHRHIADIVEYLTPDDLLVVNDTKVFPARLIGTWSDTPGEVEVLMVAAAPEMRMTGIIGFFDPLMYAILVKVLFTRIFCLAMALPAPRLIKYGFVYTNLPLTSPISSN